MRSGVFGLCGSPQPGRPPVLRSKRALAHVWRPGGFIAWMAGVLRFGAGSSGPFNTLRTPITMKSMLKTCAALAAASVLLVACGGGNDDDPTPSNEPGVLTVSGATFSGLNGVYGNGAMNLTSVD